MYEGTSTRLVDGSESPFFSLYLADVQYLTSDMRCVVNIQIGVINFHDGLSASVTFNKEKWTQGQVFPSQIHPLSHDDKLSGIYYLVGRNL